MSEYPEDSEEEVGSTQQEPEQIPEPVQIAEPEQIPVSATPEVSEEDSESTEEELALAGKCGVPHGVKDCSGQCNFPKGHEKRGIEKHFCNACRFTF